MIIKGEPVMIFCSQCREKVIIKESQGSCERMQCMKDPKGAMLFPEAEGHIVVCEECLEAVISFHRS